MSAGIEADGGDTATIWAAFRYINLTTKRNGTITAFTSLKFNFCSINKHNVIITFLGYYEKLVNVVKATDLVGRDS